MAKTIDFFWGYYGFVNRAGLHRNHTPFFAIEESDRSVIHLFCV